MANIYLDGLRKRAGSLSNMFSGAEERMQNAISTAGDNIKDNFTNRVQSDPIGFVTQYPTETWNFIKSDPSRAAGLIWNGLRSHAGHRAAPFEQDYAGAMEALRGTGYMPIQGMGLALNFPRDFLVE